MAAKLVLAMVVLAIVVSVAVLAAFWYFKETAEMNHEKEMRRLERDEELFSNDSFDSEIDRELQREKED